MLSRVARKDQPPACSADETDEIEQLLTADLPGFVHEDDGPFRQARALNALADGLRSLETISRQVNYLLSLRCQHNGRLAASVDCALYALKHEAFPSTGAAAEKCDEASRRKN